MKRDRDDNMGLRVIHDGLQWTVLHGAAANRNPAYLPPPLHDADVIWALEFEHMVRYIHGDTDLGRSTLISARSQTVTDDPFEASDVSPHQSPPVTPEASCQAMRPRSIMTCR